MLVVALSTLFAGCLGGVPGTDPGDGGADGAADPSPTVFDTDAGSIERLELTDAEAALRDAGSFTSTWTYSGTDVDGTDGEVSYTYYGDLDGDRAHVAFSTVSSDQGEVTGWEQFSTGTKTYSRFGSDEGTFYQVQENELDVVGDVVSRAGIYTHGDVSDLSYEGTEQYDGVTVERYELTDAQSMFWRTGAAAGANGGAGAESGLEIREFEYVVLIDDDGLSRSESWSYTGRTDEGQIVSARWEYSLTKVGSTTFDDPEWLAEADAQVRSQG